MKQLGVSSVDQGGGKASFSHSNGSKPSERWLPFSISGSSAPNGGAICRHNCRTSKRAQFGENQNCLMWKGIVWSEWQDLRLSVSDIEIF
jgi:hypothetical protein